MTCNRAMRRILALDNGQQPNRRTAAHLRSCRSCNSEYARLRPALTLLRSGYDHTADGDLSRRIMAAVWRGTLSQVRNRTRFWTEYGKWAAAGLMIVAGMMTLPYTVTLTSLRLLPGSRIDATLAVAFGLIVSAYIGVFIATHLEDLMRMLRKNEAP